LQLDKNNLIRLVSFSDYFFFWVKTRVVTRISDISKIIKSFCSD
jgi:hypothetical protein